MAHGNVLLPVGLVVLLLAPGTGQDAGRVCGRTLKPFLSETAALRAIGEISAAGFTAAGPWSGKRANAHPHLERYVTLYRPC